MLRRSLFLLVLSCIVFLCRTDPVFASNKDSIWGKYKDTTRIHPGRLAGALSAEGALYVGSLGGLYFAWYNHYPQSSFHFFDDSGEWQWMDKSGHLTTAYYISMIGYNSFRWSGIGQRRSAIYGSLLGFAYLLNIEILDGFSKQWGFSPGDLTANATGCLIFLGQQVAWNEQRFVMKYSFHTTGYAQYRPDLLGDNLIQQMLKDYNGQTYWFSGNISSFLPKKTKFPKWINVAFGYGAEGMTGASANAESHDGVTLPHYTRYRKFMLSLDVDLTRIQTRCKPLKAILTVFSFLKIPFPAVEYNTLGHFKFYPFYY